MAWQSMSFRQSTDEVGALTRKRIGWLFLMIGKAYCAQSNNGGQHNTILVDVAVDMRAAGNGDEICHHQRACWSVC